MRYHLAIVRGADAHNAYIPLTGTTETRDITQSISFQTYADAEQYILERSWRAVFIVAWDGQILRDCGYPPIELFAPHR